MGGDSNEVLKTILDQVAREQKYNDCKINVKCISSGGANYTSHLRLATISAPAARDLKLFVKIAAMSEATRETTKLGARVFQTESFFYNTILKAYRDLEERNMASAEHRFVTPKFYACHEECLKEALVLEDMTASGYQSFDRFKSIDWNYAAKSVQNLAKFHALSIAWSRDAPEEFKKTSCFKSEDIAFTFLQFLKKSLSKGLEVTRTENKARMAKFLEDNTEEEVFAEFFKPMRCTVIAHGDYRPSNLLHRFLDNGEVDVIAVDYQTLLVGNPIIDLVYFIFVGSDRNFRRHHYKQTVEHYYKELRAALKRLNLDPDEIYPREDFDQELKKVLPLGLLTATLCLLIVTVNEEDAPKVSNSIELDLDVPPNELYNERLNDIIDDYIDMGVF